MTVAVLAVAGLITLVVLARMPTVTAFMVAVADLSALWAAGGVGFLTFGMTTTAVVLLIAGALGVAGGIGALFSYRDYLRRTEGEPQ